MFIAFASIERFLVSDSSIQFVGAYRWSRGNLLYVRSLLRFSVRAYVCFASWMAVSHLAITSIYLEPVIECAHFSFAKVCGKKLSRPTHDEQ